MKKHFYCLLFSVCLMMFISGCSKENLYNLVVGGQPAFFGRHQYVAGLNIFGVIRPDSVNGRSMNLMHIEKVIPAVGNPNDSTTVYNFNASIYKINDNIVTDSLCFTYNYPDTLFTHRPADFKPMPGNHFKISCQSPGLPVLTAETIIPGQPGLVNDSITISGNKVQFSIIGDTTAYLYDIYLFVGGFQYTRRILRAKTGNTAIEIKANTPEPSDTRLLIYAYDKNLSEYLTVANLFIKPNTYRPPFSTVQNGYGCFGSLNLLTRQLDN